VAALLMRLDRPERGQTPAPRPGTAA
jgi:hypothetical protein